MKSPENPAPEEGARRRRQRLLAEIFRNALALAIVKQALVGGSSVAELGTNESANDSKGKIPPHLLG